MGRERTKASMAETTEITLRRPDDWHLHLRDGVMLETVVAFTARRFARAIVMPNLAPPITTARRAVGLGVAFLARFALVAVDFFEVDFFLAGAFCAGALAAGVSTVSVSDMVYSREGISGADERAATDPHDLA